QSSHKGHAAPTIRTGSHRGARKSAIEKAVATMLKAKTSETRRIESAPKKSGHSLRRRPVLPVIGAKSDIRPSVTNEDGARKARPHSPTNFTQQRSGRPPGA